MTKSEKYVRDKYHTPVKNINDTDNKRYISKRNKYNTFLGTRYAQ